MTSLNEKQLRYQFDYRVLHEMQSRTDLLKVSAYRSADDLIAARRPILTLEEAHQAKHYLVKFLIPTLVGAGKKNSGTDVHFDLSNDRYPFVEPGCWVVSSPKPWSPHFHQGGSICTGGYWQLGGKILLAHLVLHICRLLNFDEVPHPNGYEGWNGEAIRYWKSSMNYGQVTPGIKYPSLPTDLLYAAQPAPQTNLFAAKSRVAPTPTPAAVFAFKQVRQ